MKKGRAKESIYKSYRTNHNDLLYGRTTITSIESNFSTWSFYYRRHLPESKEARILDIGCGEGGFIYFLRHLGYTNVVGIDLSAEQVALGQELGIEGLIQGDLRPYLQSGEQFDFIVARDVVEHFDKDEVFDLVSLVFSGLRHQGRFMMQVPNGEGIFSNSIYYGDFTHESFFSHLSVRQLFRTIGFAEVQSYGTGPVPKNAIGLLRLVLWKLRVASHRFWKMVETGSSSGIFTSNLISIGIKAR